MSKIVDLYFDFSSPNAYLGYVQLKRLKEDLDFEINLRPVFLGGIMKELETTPPAMQNEKKSDYLTLDIKRWADFYDIPFEFPADFPVDSLRAIRGVIALESIQGNSLHDYVQAVFEAAWSEKKDISDSAVLENCLPEGIDSSRFNELVESQDVKDDLKRRSDDALDRGVFGCPMFYVEDEPFWGKDRMQLIEDRLAG